MINTYCLLDTKMDGYNRHVQYILYIKHVILIIQDGQNIMRTCDEFMKTRARKI